MKTFISKIIETHLIYKSLFLACLFVAPILLTAQPGYDFSYSTGTYNDLASPTILTLLSPGGYEVADEGMTNPTNLGFTFKYNGIDYTTYRVNANGFVNIGSALDDMEIYFDNSLRSTTVKAILAPFWSDLYLFDSNGANIAYELSGTPGTQILKIQFQYLSYWGDDASILNFQVWLYEGTNVIEFRYGGFSGWSGQAASIGINDERDNSFLSVTPGSVPTVSSSIADDAINPEDIGSGSIYTFTPLPVLQWTGTTDNDWATSTNWNPNIVPTSVHNVLIPSGKSNYPVLDGGGNLCQELSVEAGGSITITGNGDLTINGNMYNVGDITVQSSGGSSGSLIIKGLSSGNITYKRYMTGNEWHVISSPVTGQSIKTHVENTDNAIATNVEKFGVGTYDEASDSWTTYTTSTLDAAGNFISGMGYEVMRSSDGQVTFSGTYVGFDFTGIPLTRSSADLGWNLIGNPYPSAINATEGADPVNNFLTVNSSALDANFAAIYLWDPSSDSYQTISNSGGDLSQDHIQAGQAFFVRSKTGGSNVDITRDMQSHQSGAEFKSGTIPWPTVNLVAESNGLKSSTVISFNNDMTLGLDKTYDAGMFKGGQEISVYSRLVKDNGVDFAIQCLPENYDNLVIPIGIDAPVGSEVTFHADVSYLPGNFIPYLENKITGEITLFDSKESSYTIVIDEKNKGVGTFYLHTNSGNITKANSLSKEEPFQILVNRESNSIRINSLFDIGSRAQLVDISGRIIETKELHYGNDNILYVDGRPGIYIIRIQNEQYRTVKKIVW